MDLRPDVNFDKATDIDRRSVESSAAVLAHDSNALIRHHMMILDLTENLALSILDDIEEVKDEDHNPENTVENEKDQKARRVEMYREQIEAGKDIEFLPRG